MEYQISTLALGAHSFAQLIENYVYLFVNFHAALGLALLGAHSLQKRDQLVHVQLYVRGALNRHL